MWRKERPDLPDPKPHTPRYECHLCKCLMETAFKTIQGPYKSDIAVYCGNCAPAYDEVRYAAVPGQDYMGHGYFRMMRCNMDGTPWVDPWENLKNAKKSK